jgi:hypothetical protein
MSTRRKAARRAPVVRRRPVSTSREGAVVVAGVGLILAAVYNLTTGMVVFTVALLIFALDWFGRRRR